MAVLGIKLGSSRSTRTIRLPPYKASVQAKRLGPDLAVHVFHETRSNPGNRDGMKISLFLSSKSVIVLKRRNQFYKTVFVKIEGIVNYGYMSFELLIVTLNKDSH